MYVSAITLHLAVKVICFTISLLILPTKDLLYISFLVVVV